MTPDTRSLLSRGEIAAKLGWHHSTVYELVRKGRFAKPDLMIVEQPFYQWSTVLAWLQATGRCDANGVPKRKRAGRPSAQRGTGASTGASPKPVGREDERLRGAS